MEKNRNENNRKNPLNKSFGYAFEGIRTGIRKAVSYTHLTLPTILLV